MSKKIYKYEFDEDEMEVLSTIMAGTWNKNKKISFTPIRSAELRNEYLKVVEKLSDGFYHKNNFSIKNFEKGPKI